MASSSPAIDDSLDARIPPSCPAAVAEVLRAAWSHDVAAIKKYLDEPGRASAQDPTTGETPLHAAVRSCGPAPAPAAADREDAGESTGGDDDDDDLERAKQTVHELLLWGGIWNDVDDHNETPGCVALRLGRRPLYNLCVEAGMRAEMLFGLLDGYEELESGSEADDEDMAAGDDGGEDDLPAHVEVDTTGMDAKLEDGEHAPDLIATSQFARDLAEMGGDDDDDDKMDEGQDQEEEEEAQEAEPTLQPPRPDADAEVKSEKYLRSKLTYSDGKLVDDAGNGVMMAWETEIMRRSVAALIPDSGSGKPSGKRILNIGFGMGIIDSMFAAANPARHHIIEAHEEVLAQLDAPGSKFGAAWEAGAPEEGAFKVHRGRWQDIVPMLLERGEVYDAVYFDTFGEDYSQLRKFFTEYIPGLLESDGVFGFFNGLGADRQICYDVYTKVVELHLADAGMDVEWQEIDVDLTGLEEAGKGEWEGVKRRYWTLDSKCFLTSLICLRSVDSSNTSASQNTACLSVPFWVEAGVLLYPSLDFPIMLPRDGASAHEASLGKVLRVQDTGHITLLDALEGQGGNQGGTNTRSVLSSQDFDGVLIALVSLGGPVEDLAQSLSATGLEVRVLVEHGAVGANVRGLIALLLADGGDAAGGQTGGSGTDKLGGPADKLQLGQVGPEIQLVEEQIEGLLEVLKGVTVKEGQLLATGSRISFSKVDKQKRQRKQSQKCHLERHQKQHMNTAIYQVTQSRCER